MALESQRETIGGLDFEVRQLPVKDARRLMLRLAPVIGAVVGGIDIEAAQAGTLDAEKAVGAVVLGLSQVKAEDYEWTCELLGKVSQVHHEDGRSQFLSEKVQGDLFLGRRKLELGWLAFAIKVQFADFFGESANG